MQTDAERRVVALLRRHAEPLPDPDEAGPAGPFARAFERFAGARVVLLGEATHGTSEFYRARAAITRHLIEHHGFGIVAVEADWPDAAQVDAYVRHRELPGPEAAAFRRFPTWMWRNREVWDFAEWMRGHNAGLAPGERAGFRGLDVYGLGGSIRAVLRYLDEVDPAEAAEARRRYGCLTPWHDDPVRYGRAVLRGQHPCEDKAVEELRRLLDRRLDYVGRGSADAFLDAAQSARAVVAAEGYYRAMYHGRDESWNLRDRHMADTLHHLLEARGPGSKAVVWAHNSHIGDASATAMGWRGQFNLGELARRHYGRDAVPVGFGTDRGTVIAARDWDTPGEVRRVVPAREDSYEALFREAGVPRCLVHWRGTDRAELREALAEPRLERAIGVVYRPETELASHYFEAQLSEQFDAFVWFEETAAVTPLPAPEGAEEEPDLFPFGI